jgi:dTDP-4-dehydrorhamnose reductase
VLGAFGFVGSRVRQRWPAAGLELITPSHAELDVLDAAALAAFLSQSQASAVLNLAAWADVDGAEAQRGQRDGRVYQLNAAFPQTLAALCGEHHTYLLHVSTDYVFDGTNAERPYREADPTAPLSWYAESKLGGERGVLGSGAAAGVARIEMPFSGEPYPRRDLARTMAGRLEAGQPISGVADQRITPVFLDDAVDALRLMLEARYAGVMHVAPTDWTTPLQFATSIARRLDLDTSLVQTESFANFTQTRPARRPQHSWLDVSHFQNLFGAGVLRSVEAELDQWIAQYRTVSHA